MQKSAATHLLVLLLELLALLVLFVNLLFQLHCTVRLCLFDSLVKIGLLLASSLNLRLGLVRCRLYLALEPRFDLFDLSQGALLKVTE